MPRTSNAAPSGGHHPPIVTLDELVKALAAVISDEVAIDQTIDVLPSGLEALAAVISDEVDGPDDRRARGARWVISDKVAMDETSDLRPSRSRRSMQSGRMPRVVAP